MRGKAAASTLVKFKYDSESFNYHLELAARSQLARRGKCFSLDDLKIANCNLSKLNLSPFIVVREFQGEDGPVYNNVNCHYSAKKIVFQGGTLADTNFNHCNLQSANFRNCILKNVYFEHLDLSNADFTGATLIDCWFRRCKLVNTSFAATSFKFITRKHSLTFSDCTFKGNNFEHSDISEVTGLIDIFRNRLGSSARASLMGSQLPKEVIQELATDALDIVNNWEQLTTGIQRRAPHYMEILSVLTKLAYNYSKLKFDDLGKIANKKVTNISINKFKSKHHASLKHIAREIAYLTILKITINKRLDLRYPLPTALIERIFALAGHALPDTPFLTPVK